jgi:DNA-binding NtrC family response regulator
MCPYKGLQPFTERDHKYFFGREEDQQTIGANLLTAPLTVLYGSSGVGKSSVLQAGVIPFLRSFSDVHVILFRTWLAPSSLDELRQKVKEQLNVDETSTTSLDALLTLAGRTGTTAVIFDQFEDYLFYHRDTQAAAEFDAEFARAVNRRDVNARFLISMREDSLAMLDRYQGRIPNLLGNYLRLKHLTRSAAERAIKLPLNQYNVDQAAGVPVDVEEKLINDVLMQVRAGQLPSGQGGHGALEADTLQSEQLIEAPFLQIVLERLWNEDADSGILKAATLERLGGAAKLVEAHLDDVMLSLPSFGQEVCARCFDRLVTPTGKKIAYTEEDLARYAADLRFRLPEVLRILTENRILRAVVMASDDRGAPRYELFHDVLSPAILDWCAKYRTGRSDISRTQQQSDVSGIVGQSPAMRQLYERIRRIALTDATVLIRGETGTGKELVARTIHECSARASGPFIAVNCALLNESLLESQLFGHEKGAFTGAVSQKKGAVELATGGTLFLDEIGELAFPVQSQLLRALQERTFIRVGGTRSLSMDVRMIASTDRDLESAVKDRRFREDLFYRLNVVSLTVPPLRQRREDILPLALHFLEQSAQRSKRHVTRLSKEVGLVLANYDWPGNVRELQNAIEFAVVFGTSEVIQAEDLPEQLLVRQSPGTPRSTYQQAIIDAKRRIVLDSMQRAKGDRTEAARLLGVSSSSLARLLRDLNLKEVHPPSI